MRNNKGKTGKMKKGVRMFASVGILYVLTCLQTTWVPFAIWQYCFFGLAFTVCMSLLGQAPHPVLLATVCGGFSDIACKTPFPICTVLQLYISVGCVFAAHRLIRVCRKTVFFVSLLSAILYGTAQLLFTRRMWLHSIWELLPGAVVTALLSEAMYSLAEWCAGTKRKEA